MKGDFSRFTFDKKKHYSGVLMQQGRVQLDADINEQQAIVQHLAEARTSDIIGPRGVPKTGGGFEISLASDGTDLAISSGNIYVDGILCQTSQDKILETYRHQDDLPDAALPTVPGRYLAYMDVFSRAITALDDPNIKEKALGGADTSLRVKTVWQVKLKQVTSNDNCHSFQDRNWKPFSPASGKMGEMTAKPKDVSDTVDLCAPLPPTTGYRRLENQLYRVEIHKGGNRSEATFKWSRENGSIEAPIRSVSGKTITLERISRDEALGFGDNQWMEISTDRTEQGDGIWTPLGILKPQGIMVRSLHVHESKPEITLLSAPSIAIDIDQQPEDKTIHPRLRRWDQNSGDENGIRLDSTDPIELDGEIQVSFSEGDYYPGDYWLIPARTAIAEEMGGIEWPMNGGISRENSPKAQLRHGVRHHYCPLAVLQFDGQKFIGQPEDCRPKFPSLTDITASDIPLDKSICIPGARTVQEALNGLCQRNGSKCTLNIWPGIDMAQAFKSVVDCKDLFVFIHAGTYELANTINIAGKNSVLICGCGPSSSITGCREESVFHFVNCDSAEIRDLSAWTDKVGYEGKKKHLNGTLTFSYCRNVKVYNADIRCGEGAEREASCITVRSAQDYMFCWDEIPGKDNEKLIEFLLQSMGIEWAIDAKIEKIDEGKTIKVSTETNILYLELYQDTTVRLKIDERHINRFVARREKGRLNIYTIATPVESVRIRDCNLAVGQQQVGILLINVKHAHVEGNLIAAAPPGLNSVHLLSNKKYHATVRNLMMHSVEVGKAAKPGTPNTVVVDLRQRDASKLIGPVISFKTNPRLVEPWNKWIKRFPPEGIANDKALAIYIKRLADDAVTNERYGTFRDWHMLLAQELAQNASASQGIVVVGALDSDIRVLNNNILNTAQGIHIGVSHRTTDPGDYDLSKGIWISGNRIKVFLLPGTSERHGIFVGNCSSLALENNYIEAYLSEVCKGQSIDGIRIYGKMGKRAIVRQNHIEFNSSYESYGICFSPLSSLAEDPQWVIADNAVSKGAFSVMIPKDSVPDESPLRKLMVIGPNYPPSIGK